MTGIRRGWFGGLAALLLAGCASYPATYYEPGDTYGYGYGGDVASGGDYSYGETYVDDGAYWSPTWSTYYSTVLYPPYGRSYDPWYTPGFHYGYGYAPGAGWRIGWRSWRYDPWWGGGWYSPYRHGWSGYRPDYYGYGYGYGHGYNGWYGNRGDRSNRQWRDLERRYGRRAYDPDRRVGGDQRASDEVDRIARRQGAGQYDPRPGGNAWRDGTQDRSGAPSAYDRRRDGTAGRNQPSRFGNPAGAAPPARNDDNTGDSGGLGRRSNGWVAPAPSDGGYSRRGASPQGEPGESVDLESRRDRGGYDNRWRGAERAPARTDRAPRQWTSGDDQDRASRQGYRRIETPRAWGGSEPAQRGGWRDSGAGGSDLGRVPAPRDDGSRYQRQSMPGDERQAAPRYEQQASPRFERQATPRYEQPSSPRFEQPARYEAPSRGDDRGSRQDSPRFEAPSRDDGGGRSASRELERIQRDDQRP